MFISTSKRSEVWNLFLIISTRAVLANESTPSEQRFQNNIVLLEVAIDIDLLAHQQFLLERNICILTFFFKIICSTFICINI